MKDKIWKIIVLLATIKSVIEVWKEQVWDVELDELFCCNGRECGCQGITNRQQIQWQYQVDVPPTEPNLKDMDW